MAKRQKKTRGNPTGVRCPEHPTAQQSANGCTAKGCTFRAPPERPALKFAPCPDHKGATQTANGCTAKGCTFAGGVA